MKVAPMVYLRSPDQVVVSVKSAVKANISIEAYEFYLHQSLPSEVNYCNIAFVLIN